MALRLFCKTGSFLVCGRLCKLLECLKVEQILATYGTIALTHTYSMPDRRRHSDSSGAGAQPVLAAPTTPRVAPSVLCVHPRVLQLPPAAPPSAQAARQRNPPSSRRARHSTGSVALLGDLAAIRDHGGKSGYRRHSVCMSSSSNSAGRDAVLGDGGDGEELDVLADCGGMCLPVGVRRVLLWGAHGQDAQQQQQQQQQQQEGKQQRDQQPSGQEETREEGLGQGAAVVRVVVVPPESVWSGSHDARAAAEAEDEVQVMPVRDGEWEQGAGAQGGAAVTLVRGRRMAAQRHQHEDGGARCYEVVLWGLGAAAWGTRTRGSCFAGILVRAEGEHGGAVRCGAADVACCRGVLDPLQGPPAYPPPQVGSVLALLRRAIAARSAAPSSCRLTWHTALVTPSVTPVSVL